MSKQSQLKFRKQRQWVHLKELGYIGDSLAKINRIEERASKLNEDYCSVEMSEGRYKQRSEAIVRQVTEVFGGELPKYFYFNTDPRGYALKLDAPKEYKETMHRDMGGYIILAPEIQG